MATGLKAMLYTSIFLFSLSKLYIYPCEKLCEKNSILLTMHGSLNFSNISLVSLIITDNYKPNERRVKLKSNLLIILCILLLLSGDIETNPGPNASSLTTHNNRLSNYNLAHDTQDASSLTIHDNRLSNYSLDHDTQNATNERNNSTFDILDNNYVFDYSLHYQIEPDTCDLFSIDVSALNLSTNNDDHLKLNELEPEGPKMKGLRIACLNVCSLPNKIVDIKDILERHKFDIFCVTETHLDEMIMDSAILIDGFQLVRKDRTRHGGGVAIYIKHSIDFVLVDLVTPIEFLCIELKSKHIAKSILISVVYRPPASPTNPFFFSSIAANLNQLPANSPLYILGDFNIDWLTPCKSNSITEKINLEQLCADYNFEQLINEPTRTTLKSSSCIDHIYTNTLKTVESGIIHAGISDHDLIYCTYNTHGFKSKTSNTVKSFRSFKNFNEEDFLHDLERLPWNDIDYHTDIDVKWSIFKSLFLYTCDKHAPIIHKKERGNPTPWLTKDLLCILHERDYFKKKAVKSKQDHDWEMYKKLRNKANSAKIKAKRDYYRELILENKNAPKQLWNTIKHLSNNEKTKPDIQSLTINNKIIRDRKTIAEHMNNFFVGIGHTLASKFKTLTLDNNNTSLDHPEFVFSCIEEDSVLKLLLDINGNKATGLDRISPKLLKIASPAISKPLTKIFNNSLKFGVIPHEWKSAKVLPLYKNGSKLDPSNYRPISILPAVSKIFERLVHDQLYCYLQNFNLLTPFQSGFRKKHSTMSTLLHFTDSIYGGMDHGEATLAVFIDLKKAFDTVDHELLLLKLDKLGVKGAEFNWFKNYLQQRTQVTTLSNNSESNIANITIGVPQGSILGPLLFSIFINDLPKALSQCNTHLYADDTVIYFRSKDPSALQSIISQELININSWFQENRLTLNVLKTKWMLFCTSKQASKFEGIKISINNMEIDKVETFKYLGVNLDQRLNWQTHIEVTLKTIKQKIILFRKLRPFLTHKIAQTVSHSLIISKLLYCSPVWSGCSPTSLKRLASKYHQTAKIILQVPNLTSSDEALLLLNWLNFYDKLEFDLIVATFKGISNFSPSYIKELLKHDNHPVYKTRSCDSKTKLKIPKVKTNSGKLAFSYRASHLWNSQPINIQNVDSLTSLCTYLNSFYLAPASQTLD